MQGLQFPLVHVTPSVGASVLDGPWCPSACRGRIRQASLASPCKERSPRQGTSSAKSMPGKWLAFRQVLCNHFHGDNKALKGTQERGCG